MATVGEKRQQESTPEGYVAMVRPSPPKRPKSEPTVNDNHIFARLSEHFTPKEIEEIQKVVPLNHDHSISLRNVEQIVHAAIADRQANYWRAGIQGLLFKDTKTWRRRLDNHVYPQASIATRNAWLFKHGFSVNALKPVKTAHNAYYDQDWGGPIVHWVNLTTQVVITGQFSSFGFAQYCSVSGPAQAARATYDALLADTAFCTLKAPYYNNLCQDLDPNQHAELMRHIDNKDVKPFIAPNNVFDPATCETNEDFLRRLFGPVEK